MTEETNTDANRSDAAVLGKVSWELQHCALRCESSPTFTECTHPDAADHGECKYEDCPLRKNHPAPAQE